MNKVSGRLPGLISWIMGCKGPGFHAHERSAVAGGQGLASTVQSRMAEANVPGVLEKGMKLY